MSLKKNVFMLVAVCSLMLPITVNAETARIAVASNFSPAMKALKEKFESQSTHRIKLAFGSTGKHYAQIVHGAPFDAFFAADTQRPQLLDKANKAIPGSRFVYALGHLVMWSPDTSLINIDVTYLDNPQINYVAIANPKLAPYGFAAKQVLQKLHYYKKLKGRFVFGENISQTYQFVASGNAQVGFIALSLLKNPHKQVKGQHWLIPQEYYSSIAQEAILLSDNTAATEFVNFIKTATAKDIIQHYGYSLPKLN